MNQTSSTLPVGKLSPTLLSDLIAQYTTKDESVIVGAQIGEDAAVIDQGDHYLIAKTDPITFVTEEIGYYTIHINSNDIACMGGIPRWFLATLLLPEGLTTEELVRKIFAQLSEAAQQLNIQFCGGHTEITHGISRPIIIGQMLGEVEKQNLVINRNAAVGDDVLLTGGIAIEATSIIAHKKGERLAEIYSEDLVEKCKNFIYDPGISVFNEAQLALKTGGVHALHDPTEGGLAMGLHELAAASGKGLKIFDEEIPIIAESKLLCDQYNIEPLGAIASGALLIVADPHSTPEIIKSIRAANITIKNIGKVMPEEYGVKLISNDVAIKLPAYHQDEIVKLFK